MAAETLSPPGPEAEYGRHLAADKSDPARRVGATEFATRAEDIFSGINYLRDQGTTEHDAYSQVSVEYIYGEEAPELALFSEVILAAPVIMHEQHHAQQLQTDYRYSRDRNTYDEYRDVVRTLVGYNHKLRDLIYQNPQGFTKDQLVGWLEKAAGNARGGVESLINGVTAEVAVKKELNAMPEVTTNRFASVEEDAQGADLVAGFSNGTTCTIDVKHGERATFDGYDRRRDGKVILGLTPDDLQDFRIKRQSRDAVRRQLLVAAGMALIP